MRSGRHRTAFSSLSIRQTDTVQEPTCCGSYRPNPGYLRRLGCWCVGGEATAPLPPVAQCGFIRHICESLTRQHRERPMLVPLEGAGAGSGARAVLLRRKTLQSTGGGFTTPAPDALGASSAGERAELSYSQCDLTPTGCPGPWHHTPAS